ncbi:hypothetical protein ACS0TY_016786 [Phlomoides rotata]
MLLVTVACLLLSLVSSKFNGAGRGSGHGSTEKEWELRSGGMLVQKRANCEESCAPPPTIGVRVKYESIYHEIWELNEMLYWPTGLHHQDQKLLYKDPGCDSNAFLDSAGVKDKSKIVLEEDPISKEKHYLEMRKNAKMGEVAKTLSYNSLEVERLGGQVSTLETVISKGGKVVEKDVVNLIQLLMNQFLKLDSITADESRNAFEKRPDIHVLIYIFQSDKQLVVADAKLAFDDNVDFVSRYLLFGIQHRRILVRYLVGICFSFLIFLLFDDWYPVCIFTSLKCGTLPVFLQAVATVLKFLNSVKCPNPILFADHVFICSSNARDWPFQMKNLTKEDFVHVLRCQSTGFSRGIPKYKGVTLHKCGCYEAGIHWEKVRISIEFFLDCLIYFSRIYLFTSNHDRSIHGSVLATGIAGTCLL